MRIITGDETGLVKGNPLDYNLLTFVVVALEKNEVVLKYGTQNRAENEITYLCWGRDIETQTEVSLARIFVF